MRYRGKFTCRLELDRNEVQALLAAIEATKGDREPPYPHWRVLTTLGTALKSSLELFDGMISL